MRKLLLQATVLFLISVIVCSCSNFEKEIHNKSISFLNLFFLSDYENAATLCTDSLGSEITKMLSSYETLDTSIKTMIREQVSSLDIQVVSVVKSDGRDSVKVDYYFLLPGTADKIERSLSFIKENGEWRVAKLGL